MLYKKTLSFLLFASMFYVLPLSCIGAVSGKFTEKEAKEFLEKVAFEASNFDSLSAQFIQDKHLNFMQEAIRTEGYFYFSHDAHDEEDFTLIWEYLTPAISGILYSNTSVLLWNDSRKNSKVPSEQEEPFVKLMAKELIFWMDLDVKEIYNKYYVEMIEKNTVLLKPKKANTFQTVTLTFADDSNFLHKITLDEGEGNYINLLFSDIEKNTLFINDFSW